MKNWTAPTIKCLNPGENVIKWDVSGGWFKWNGQSWDCCGHNYKPGQNDILISES